MIIEKFEDSSNKPYVVFRNATFASSKNKNGCNFDPVETFMAGYRPNKFNLNHSSQEVEAEITSDITYTIDNALLTFTADITSYDPYIIENADKVTGFSPELRPIKQPVRKDNERFYGSKDLFWEGTSFLIDKPAGFVGADKSFELEKFEDIAIYQYIPELTVGSFYSYNDQIIKLSIIAENSNTFVDMKGQAVADVDTTMLEVVDIEDILEMLFTTSTVATAEVVETFEADIKTITDSLPIEVFNDSTDNGVLITKEPAKVTDINQQDIIKTLKSKLYGQSN